MIKIDPLVTTPARAPESQPSRSEAAMQQAREFEAVFIAQMLKHSGFEKALTGNSGFGGESYASMLLEQYAEKITERGGFGLAENIYNQLIERGDDNGSIRSV